MVVKKIKVAKVGPMTTHHNFEGQPLIIEVQKHNISGKCSYNFTKLSVYVKVGLPSGLIMLENVHMFVYLLFL